MLGPKFTDWDAVGEVVNSRKRQAARRFAKLKADGATADAVEELTRLAVVMHDRLWELATGPPGTLKVGKKTLDWKLCAERHLADAAAQMAVAMHDRLLELAIGVQLDALRVCSENP